MSKAKKREARLLKIIDSMSQSLADVNATLLMLERSLVRQRERLDVLGGYVNENTLACNLAVNEVRSKPKVANPTKASCPEVRTAAAPIESKAKVDTHALFDLSERSDVASTSPLPGDNYSSECPAKNSAECTGYICVKHNRSPYGE